MSIEFFAMPEELVRWLSKAVLDSDNLWLFALDTHRHKYIPVEEPSNSIFSMYCKTDLREEALQFFVGKKQISRHPVMTRSGGGWQKINFSRSYCIQIVPSFKYRNLLLMGRIGYLDKDKYSNEMLAMSFMVWKNQMIRKFKTISSKQHRAGTVSTQGRFFEHRGLYISDGAVEWHQRGGLLKQFVRGSVDFVPERR